MHLPGHQASHPRGGPHASVRVCAECVRETACKVHVAVSQSQGVSVSSHPRMMSSPLLSPPTQHSLTSTLWCSINQSIRSPAHNHTTRLCTGTRACAPPTRQLLHCMQGFSHACVAHRPPRSQDAVQRMRRALHKSGDAQEVRHAQILEHVCTPWRLLCASGVRGRCSRSSCRWEWNPPHLFVPAYS